MTKRMTGILLALILMLALAGCGSAGAGGTGGSGSGTTAPDGASETTAAARITLHTELEADADTADDGTTLLQFSYRLPVVSIAGNDAAASAINRQLAAEKTLFTEGDGTEGSSSRAQLRDIARGDYADRGAEMQPYTMSRSYLVTRGDAAVLSLVSTDVLDTDGAHGNAARSGLVFNASTGAVLKLADLSADETALRDFCTEYIRKLCLSDAYEGGAIFLEGYESSIPEVVADGWWYFSADGLVFLSNPYELAPYAAGILTFTVPYDVLGGVLDEQWFPVPSQDTGLMTVRAADGATDGAVDRVDTTNGTWGTEYLLSAEGTVEGVTVNAAAYQEDGTMAEEFTWWYGSVLNDGEALALTAMLPDAAPNLQLRYTSGGSQMRRWLQESGKDGSLSLYDPEGCAGG